MPRKVLTYPVTEVNKVIRYKHQGRYRIPAHVYMCVIQSI